MTFLLAGLPGAGSAQEETLLLDTEPTHRAAIHAGTCAELGEEVFRLDGPVYGLDQLEGVAAAATPDPGEATIVGPNEAIAAAVSVTTIPVGIDELVRDPHAVELLATVVDEPPRVCGAIGGVRVDDHLVFGLKAFSPTAYVGTAWLHQNPDGTTTVTLFMASGLSADDQA